MDSYDNEILLLILMDDDLFTDLIDGDDGDVDRV